VSEAVQGYFGSQLSEEAFFHAGSGGSMLWVDPPRDLVILWLSVWAAPSFTKPNLFVNALVESIDS
jgi:CubicO group peptidase (beta-lactamase class C family)